MNIKPVTLRRNPGHYSFECADGEYRVRNVGEYHRAFHGTCQHWQVTLNGKRCPHLDSRTQKGAKAEIELALSCRR